MSLLSFVAERATLEIYEGAPHALMLTHGERLNRDLLAFAQASALAGERGAQ